jgi:hypothetical protein
VGSLQRHNAKNVKQIFPGNELRGYSPNLYIHVSVSDLYIPLTGLPILLQAVQFLFWEHINPNIFTVLNIELPILSVVY